MIFLGDLACPENKINAFIDCINSMDIFKDEIVVINLEANIVDDARDRRALTLYNVSEIVNAFGKAKKVIVSLANNHMYDYPSRILATKEILEQAGFGVFGLYERDQIHPFEYTDSDGKRYAFFGHCWRLYTNTNKNTENDVRVIDCPYDKFIDIVDEYVSNHPGVSVYCFMHWNYDLEQYPFPVHRKLSKKLIDLGVSGVIGSHSHRPQGFEIYKGKPIAYCLGNFYLPSGCYFDGKLYYPGCSKSTYGIRISESSCDRVWFDTDKNEQESPVILTRIEKDILHNHDFPDCIDMEDTVYLDFFKKNRKKKILVPVFTDLGGGENVFSRSLGHIKSKSITQSERMDEKMNILFLSLSFSTAGHTSFYEDLLREFRKHGHHVYVACANEKRSAEKDGLEMLNGLPVLRIRTGNVTGDISLIEKGLSTLTIDSFFLKAVKKEFGDVHFDLIMYPTPPITLVNTISAMKKRTGAKTYLLLKDIFPQNAVDLGMMSTTGPKSVLYEFFRRKEKKLYKISDYIGCMSPANCQYVLDHNPEIAADKVEVCPNCIRVEETDPPTIVRDSSIRRKYSIPEDAVIFIYGGNLGKPQGIPFLLKCLDREKENKKAFFLIVGTGSEYEKIQQYMDEKKPKNALLLSYLPKEDYQNLANQCDVGMIFLDHRFSIPNFPSRLLSCLRAAMPVLVATDTATDMGRIAEENGFGKWCESNSVEDFSAAVDSLIKADRHSMGLKGWKFLKDNYTLDNGFHIIMNHFERRSV